MSAPGWYPDPSGNGGQRYFDGTAWGPTAPPPPTPPQRRPHNNERRFTIHYGFALLAIFSLLGTVIPTLFWFASAANVDVEPGASQSERESAEAAGGILGFFGVGWLLWGGMWTLIWAAFAVHHTLRSRNS
ncbi:DUF2510 domain-containing protein [Mycobacterium sp. ITM-2016-00317]|uniref:DUF2510 domain-containing protein n=1 Tax=Mycobacterium sp. ITM-2016-00317 TaxID=2099694 RepID=UPI000D479C81|nr:DUF2510 domain-containing protein [Mycobacterium sp. ITM-2016-00317]WNG89547.1 DUF2510 domain-containing protein [Mycobacterium sp. ITM-2016-00317]